MEKIENPFWDYSFDEKRMNIFFAWEISMKKEIWKCPEMIDFM